MVVMSEGGGMRSESQGCPAHALLKVVMNASVTDGIHDVWWIETDVMRCEVAHTLLCAMRERCCKRLEDDVQCGGLLGSREWTTRCQ